MAGQGELRARSSCWRKTTGKKRDDFDGYIVEMAQPDRVRLVLPMVSLIPSEVEAELRERFGERFAKLDPTAVQAVVTARVEGAVTNGRMQEITGAHPKDLTDVLQGVGAGRFLGAAEPAALGQLSAGRRLPPKLPSIAGGLPSVRR